MLREKQSRSVLLCTPYSWTAGGDDPESCQQPSNVTEYYPLFRSPEQIEALRD